METPGEVTDHGADDVGDLRPGTERVGDTAGSSCKDDRDDPPHSAPTFLSTTLTPRKVT